MGPYSLLAHGKLTAVGTAGNGIVFTSGKISKATGDWTTINISTSGSDTSKLFYTTIEYGGSSVSETAELTVAGNAIVRNSMVRNSVYNGITTTASGYLACSDSEITGCFNGVENNSTKESVFIRNRVHGTGFGIMNYGTAIIRSNWIYSNDVDGILSFHNSTIEKNIIANNLIGIYASGNTTTINSNTIVMNRDGIGVFDKDIPYAPRPDVSSNIIAFNTRYGIYSEGTTFIPRSVTYNVLYGNDQGNINHGPAGVGVVVGQNQMGHPSDTYGNIFNDPDFYSTNINDSLFVYLNPTSPAINSGDPALKDPDMSVLDCGARPYFINHLKDFTLMEPGPGAVIAKDPTVKFMWHKAQDLIPTEYELIIEEGNNVLSDTRVNVDTLRTFAWQALLKQNKSYSWHVVARAGLSTVYSDTLTFTTPNFSPKAFQLLSPSASQQISTDASVSFNWNAAGDDDPVTYTVSVVSGDQKQTFEAGSAHAFIMAWRNYLRQNTTYSWYVTASDGKATTNSDTTSFKTPNLPPADFTLLSPADQEETIEPSPLAFTWHKATDDIAPSYSLSIEGNNFEINYPSLTDTVYSFDWKNILKPGNTYSWHVTASDGSLKTVSASRDFTLSITLGVEKELAATLWPNPAHNGVTVSMGYPVARVEIICTSGQVVSAQVPSGEGYVSLSDIPAGVYLIRIVKQDHSSVLKRVVKI
jgi:hypothetical protein